MLCVWYAEAAHAASGKIGNSSIIASRPSALDHAIIASHTQICVHANTTAFVDREVSILEHRRCSNTSSPNESIGIHLTGGRLICHVDELQVTVGSVRERGIEQNLNAASAKLSHNLLGTVFWNLWHDARCSFDHHEAQVGYAQTVVTINSFASHVFQFGDGLNTGETAAYDDDGQGAAASIGVIQYGCNLNTFQHPVTHGDGFFDSLHADSNFGKTGDWERTGHGTSTENDLIIFQIERFAIVDGFNRSGTLCMVNGDNMPGNQLGIAQVLAERNGSVTAFHRARSDFGQERLVSHIGVRLYDGYHATGLFDSLLNFLGDGKAYVATTDNKNTGTILCLMKRHILLLPRFCLPAAL